MGMHWGERNGPPYPLNGWQKVGNAVAKGRAALGRTLNDYSARAKARHEENTAKRKEKRDRDRAEREELREYQTQMRKEQRLAERKNRFNESLELRERERLMKLAKKHPERLTDAELKYLNERKKNEENYLRQPEAQVAKVGKELVKNVVTPTAVALGKSAVISLLPGKDFTTVATKKISEVLDSKNDDKKDDKKSKDHPPKGVLDLHGTGKKK